MKAPAKMDTKEQLTAKEILSDHVENESKKSMEDLGKTEGSIEEHLTEEYQRIERCIVKKLDCTLVPILWFMYLFNYLDRNNIA